MEKITKWALNNSQLINFVILCLTIGGIVSYLRMPKLEDPAITVKQAMVITTYPGASAHQVELEVTDKLEKSIRTIASVDNVVSQSMADLSLITVELKPTTRDTDVEQEWDKLRRKVDDVTPKLPQGASTPMVKDDFGEVFGMFYALTGDGFTDNDLSDYAELVKRNVEEVDGVSRVELYGKREDCIYIELRQDKLSNLGILPVEVVQTLNNQNKTTYSGYYNSSSNRIRVTVDDRFNNIEDIGDMLIQGHDNEQLRIKDIATIRRGFADPVRNEMFYDGQRALGISIACDAKHDVVKVGGQVENVINNLKSERLPLGVECNKVFNQPERVDSALNTFIVNLAESIIIVILVLIFTMGWRSGIIIGISLGVIVAGSLLVLNCFDGTLQRVSLAAFILAMGMLVDNAIVIVDGILTDLRTGMPKSKALTNTVGRTALPLLGATLIAILAFWPIYLSPDTAGVYVRDLFIVIAVSLLLSWLLALTHVPLMMRTTHPTTQITSTQELHSGKIYRFAERILRTSLAHPIATTLLSVFLLILCGVCYPFMNRTFFPDMEYDQLYIEYKLPEGTLPSRVSAQLNEISKYLRSRSEITHVTASVGGTPSRYNLVRSIATPSLSYGELIVDFDTPSSLTDNLDEIQSELSRRYPEAYIKLKRYNLMFKKYPIEACFHGPDPAVLHSLTDTAMSYVASSDKLYLPTTDWGPITPVFSIDYAQSDARRHNLSRSDVSTSLLAYTGGIPIGTYYNGIEPQNIYVKCLDADGGQINNLSDADVFGLMPDVSFLSDPSTLQKALSGQVTRQDIVSRITSTTPLRQISHATDILWEEPVVMRYNGQRTQRLQCSPRPGVSTEEARAELEKQLNHITLPAGYTISWQGERKASTQAMRYLFNGFPLAILLMIAILILLFRDYRKPIIIFLCIPLLLIGVIPTVLLTGKQFGFVAIVGVLGLIGMMVKNGIVLMDEIQIQLQTHSSLTDALVKSSLLRLRPVMMASLTTILGMIPLIPDALFGSLAVTIMGGLFFGTIVTLFMIPVLYKLFFDKKKKSSKPSKSLMTLVPTLTGILFIICVPSTNAQTLSIQEARTMAIERSNSVRIAQEKQIKAASELKSIRSHFYPRFELFATDFYSSASTDMNLQGGHLPIYTFDPSNNTYQPNVSIDTDGGYILNQYADFPSQHLKMKIDNFFIGAVRLTQPIYTGGKLTSSYRLGTIANNAAEAQVRLSKAEIICRTDEAYTNLLTAMAMRQVAQSHVSYLQQLKKDVESAVRHGMRTRNDLLRVQVGISEAEQKLLHANNSIQLARIVLCQLIGLPMDSQISAVFPENILFHAADIATLSIDRRPETVLLQHNIAAAEQQQHLVHSEYMPQIALHAMGNYAHGGSFQSKPLVSGADFTVGVTFSVPIATFGESSARRASAKAQHQIAIIEQDEKTQLMELELTSARLRYEEAISDYESSIKALEQAEEHLRVTRQHYDNGMAPLSELMEAQTLWETASGRQATCRCQIIVSLSKLQRAGGSITAP